MIQDLTDKLGSLVLKLLRDEHEPVHFSTISEWVAKWEGGFFKKEFVFSVIDRLH
jgi:hypothetical protein